MKRYVIFLHQGPQFLMRAPKLLRLGARLAPQKRNLIFTPDSPYCLLRNTVHKGPVFPVFTSEARRPNRRNFPDPHTPYLAWRRRVLTSVLTRFDMCSTVLHSLCSTMVTCVNVYQPVLMHAAHLSTPGFPIKGAAQQPLFVIGRNKPIQAKSEHLTEPNPALHCQCVTTIGIFCHRGHLTDPCT